MPAPALYNASLGYGWQSNTASADRTAPTALLRDFHFGTDNMFLVDLANGTYVVNVTLGDASAPRDSVDVNFLQAGKTARFRDAYEFKSADRIVTTASMQGEAGKWITFMTGEARRKK